MLELVTISIPTYRRPSVLLHAVHSCLIQDYRPLEIDIGDDSPSDETETLVRSIEVPEGVSLRYWRNSSSLKQAMNVNKLFSRARGTKLVLLHDDDVLLPGAISALYEAFSLSESVVASFGMQQIISENGECFADESVSLNVRNHRTPEAAGLQDDTVLSALWWQFPNDAYMIRRELAARVGYRPESEVADSCDFDFSLRLALECPSSKFAFIDRYTAQYRLSSLSLRSAHGCCWKEFDQVSALEHLTPRQAEARDDLLRRICEEALIDSALLGKRKRALEIFLSSFYPKRKTRAKAAYHLGLIAIPGLARLRHFLKRERVQSVRWTAGEFPGAKA